MLAPVRSKRFKKDVELAIPLNDKRQFDGDRSQA